MQKTLSVFLSILLIITVFCGCSKENQAVDSTTSTTLTTATETTSSVFETTVSSSEKSKTETKESTTAKDKSKSKSDKTTTQKRDKATTKKADKKSTNKATKKAVKTTTTTKKSTKNKSSKSTKSKSSVKSTQSFVTSDAYTVDTTQSHSQANKTDNKVTSTTSSKKTCTITIECKSILDNMDKLAKGHEKYVPSDGIIVDNYKATFNGKATVYDLLKKACDDNKIPYSAQTTTYSVYISGINNLDEFDCGQNSGWMYSVNGKFPNVSCDSTKLKDGDKVVFTYTCSYKK